MLCINPYSAGIDFSRQNLTSVVAKITFLVDGIIFKVAVMVSLVVKTTFVVTEITFLGTDIRLLVARITFVDTCTLRSSNATDNTFTNCSPGSTKDN